MLFRIESTSCPYFLSCPPKGVTDRLYLLHPILPWPHYVGIFLALHRASFLIYFLRENSPWESLKNILGRLRWRPSEASHTQGLVLFSASFIWYIPSPYLQNTGKKMPTPLVRGWTAAAVWIFQYKCWLLLCQQRPRQRRFVPKQFSPQKRISIVSACRCESRRLSMS